MTRNDALVSKNDQLQERARVLVAQEVHAAWRDGMLRQGREVAPHRMTWDTLSSEDHELDAYIAERVAATALAEIAHLRTSLKTCEKMALADTARLERSRAENARLREALGEVQTRAERSIAYERVREGCEREAAEKAHGGPVRALYQWTADYHKSNAASFEWIVQPLRAPDASGVSQAAK